MRRKTWRTVDRSTFVRNRELSGIVLLPGWQHFLPLCMLRWSTQDFMADGWRHMEPSYCTDCESVESLVLEV